MDGPKQYYLYLENLKPIQATMLLSALKNYIPPTYWEKSYVELVEDISIKINLQQEGISEK